MASEPGASGSATNARPAADSSPSCTKGRVSWRGGKPAGSCSSATCGAQETVQEPAWPAEASVRRGGTASSSWAFLLLHQELLHRHDRTFAERGVEASPSAGSGPRGQHKCASWWAHSVCVWVGGRSVGQSSNRATADPAAVPGTCTSTCQFARRGRNSIRLNRTPRPPTLGAGPPDLASSHPVS